MTPVSVHIFRIIEKHLHRMTEPQKLTIRDMINSDILRQIESRPYIDPSGSPFSHRQFGLS